MLGRGNHREYKEKDLNDLEKKVKEIIHGENVVIDKPDPLIIELDRVVNRTAFGSSRQEELTSFDKF